jgi:hypothetical protein
MAYGIHSVAHLDSLSTTRLGYPGEPDKLYRRPCCKSNTRAVRDGPVVRTLAALMVAERATV